MCALTADHVVQTTAWSQEAFLKPIDCDHSSSIHKHGCRKKTKKTSAGREKKGFLRHCFLLCALQNVPSFVELKVC